MLRKRRASRCLSGHGPRDGRPGNAAGMQTATFGWRIVPKPKNAKRGRVQFDIAQLMSHAMQHCTRPPVASRAPYATTMRAIWNSMPETIL